MRCSPRSPSPGRGPARRLAGLLLLLLIQSSLVAPLLAAPSGSFLGRRLVNVLRELQELDLDLVFSSATVGRKLRVTVEPSSDDPRTLLDQILAPLDLEAREGPGGTILVVPRDVRSGRLDGQVLSGAYRRPIAGAVLRLAPGGAQTTSDEGGRFRIEVPVGVYDLAVEMPGFSTATLRRVQVPPASDSPLVVELEVESEFVTEVIVTPGTHSLVRQEQAANHAVSGEDVVLAPTIGGDVSRLVEQLPGVAAPDNSAAYHVRGAVARDTSVVLDGMELYDPFHLQTFQSPFSLVDSSAVERIDFFGGGFTAERGDRHGGFVDIATVTPGATSGGEIEIGTLNSRVSYGAPTPNAPGSWMFSARGWYPEVFVDTTELGGGEELDPRFADVYGKAAFGVSDHALLSVHGLFAYDHMDFQETNEEVNESATALTRNGYAWLRLLISGPGSLSSETVLSGGRIERRRDGVSAPEEGAVLVDDDRDVSFLGLRHDLAWRVGDAHVLKAGIDVRRLRGDYRYVKELPDDPAASTAIRLSPRGTSLGAYAAHRLRLTSKLTGELGLRLDRQIYTGDNQLSPRFNAVWRATERAELRFALGRFTQSQRIHELQVEDGETTFGRAEVAEQVELSFRQRYPRGLRLRFDAYYRDLSKLRPRYENLFEPIELFPETIEDRVKIAPSGARLRGIEILLRGDPLRPVFWWTSYVLSSAEDVVDGVEVLRSWDQTHAVKFLVGYRRSDRWSVSLGGSAHTGWPTSPVTPTSRPDGSTVFTPIPGGRNTERFSDYLRFDFKARRSFELSRGKLTLTAEVVNLTDRNNACCIDNFVLVTRPGGPDSVAREVDYWLGFTPSATILWEF